MKPVPKALSLLATLFVASSLLFATPSLASGSEEGLSEQDAPAVDMTNARIIDDLDNRGRCLFRNGVFPEGGIGYEDPSLPYDGYAEDERAAETFRAELLRAHADSLAGVSILRGPAGDIRWLNASVTIDSTLAEALATATGDPSSFLTGITDSRPLRQAVATLEALGIPRNVEISGVVSMLDSCAVQEAIFDGGYSTAAGLPDHLGVETVSDQVTGQLVVTVPSAYAAGYDAALEEFGDAYRVAPTTALVSFQGRADLHSPRRGGSLIANSVGNGCTTAYRIDTSGMLTAGHCGNSTWYSYNYAGVTGNSGSNLIQSNNVDSRVLYGQSYTNQTWLGSPAGSSTLPVSGYVGLPNVVIGGKYLFSGA